MRWLIHSIVVMLGAAFCIAVVAYSPLPWQATAGRNLLPDALLVAMLIFGLMFVLRYRFRYQLRDFIPGLILIQAPMLLIIGRLSGYTASRILDPFNLLGLALVNLFVGLPWLLALWLASLLFKRSRSKGDVL